MKKILKWIVIILAALFLFGLWYNWKYSMGVAESKSINDPTLEHRLLLVTQQSEYKDALTKRIAKHFRGKDIHISIIDVTELAEADVAHYQRYVIMHTHIMWKPPRPVVEFLKDETVKQKVFTVSTSGDGNLIPKGVDGITSASIMLDAEKDAKRVISWITDQYTNV